MTPLGRIGQWLLGHDRLSEKLATTKGTMADIEPSSDSFYAEAEARFAEWGLTPERVRRRTETAEAEVERLRETLDRIAYTETEGLKHLRLTAHPMSHEIAVEALRSDL